MPVIKVTADDDGITTGAKIVVNILFWLGGCALEVWVGMHVLSFIGAHVHG